MEGNEIREIHIEETAKEAEKEKVTIKSRVKKAANTAWTGIKGAARWVKDNKEDLALVGSGLAIIFGYTKARGNRRSYRQEDDRDFRVYDNRTGQYYYLKRRMTNREKMELDYRLENGERMGFILDDMNLLRRY